MKLIKILKKCINIFLHNLLKLTLTDYIFKEFHLNFVLKILKLIRLIDFIKNLILILQ